MTIKPGTVVWGGWVAGYRCVRRATLRRTTLAAVHRFSVGWAVVFLGREL